MAEAVMAVQSSLNVSVKHPKEKLRKRERDMQSDCWLRQKHLHRIMLHLASEWFALSQELNKDTLIPCSFSNNIHGFRKQLPSLRRHKYTPTSLWEFYRFTLPIVRTFVWAAKKNIIYNCMTATARLPLYRIAYLFIVRTFVRVIKRVALINCFMHPACLAYLYGNSRRANLAL